MALSDLLNRLEGRQELAHLRTIPAKEPQYQKPRAPLPSEIVASMAGLGISSLYTHQASCLDAVREGKDVVVCSGTSSGKSLAFLLPIIESAIEQPESRAIILYPTNALVNDQSKAITNMLERLGGGLTCGIYTGQTPEDVRQQIRRHQPNVLLTNPEMLHYGILPNHRLWSTTFRNLDYVVVDEIHQYTGVFGSHVTHILARLRHAARSYNRSPRFIFSSATIANPQEHASALAGRDVHLVEGDGAGTRSMHFMLWNPLAAAEEGSGSRGQAIRAVNKGAVELIEDMIRSGLPTIAFVRSRKQTEELAHLVSERCPDSIVLAYHGDMAGERRRGIEEALRAGRVECVVTTNALELGIDIGDLDSCLIKGFPGSIVSVWQQAGRVGRRNEDSVVVYLAGTDALDQYFMRNPDEFFGKPIEHAVVDRSSPRILEQHLLSLLLENDVLVTDGDVIREFGNPGMDVLENLERLGYVAVVDPGRRCALCGREMVVREGRSGMFLGCSGFRNGNCNNTAPLNEGGDASERASLVCTRPDCGAVYPAAGGGRFCTLCGGHLERRIGDGRAWKVDLEATDPDALRNMQLRSLQEEEFQLVHVTGRKLGVEIGSRDLHREAHPGAIYTLGGESYRVTEIDRGNREVIVEREQEGRITIPRYEKSVQLVDIELERDVGAWRCQFGSAVYEECVSGYLEIDVQRGVKVGGGEFVNPYESRLLTKGFGLFVPAPGAGVDYGDAVRDEEAFRGGLEALRSALTTVLPSLLMCDGRDIAGMSVGRDPAATDYGAVFIYDVFDGGAGLAEKAYRILDLLIKRADDLVSSCDCSSEEGCTRCIMTGRAGAGVTKGNKRALLELFRSSSPSTPRSPK